MRFRSALVGVFASIAPTVPVSLATFFRDPDKKNFFVQTYIVTVFFCLGINIVLTAIDGRLYGSAVNKLYFYQDWQNITLYAIVVPTYVASCLSILLSAILGLRSLQDSANTVAPAESKPYRKLNLSIIIVIILTICVLFIFNYTNDILNNTSSSRLYWFMNESSYGFRSLNITGVYYVMMNCVLLFITLLGIFSFFSIFFEVIRIGHSYSMRSAELPEIDLKEFKNSLRYFTIAYLFAKITACAYIVNFYIWKNSPLGETSNLFAALIAITIIGVFFVSFPRYYVELQWNYYKQRVARLEEPDPTNEEEQEISLDDIRPPGTRMIAHFADTIIIGGFVFGAWLSYFGISF